MTKSTLTPKQSAFIDEYLIDFNGTQAAIRAGYSPKTANTIAAQNLAKLSIHSEIKERLNKRAESCERKALDIIKDLQAIKDSAMRLIFDSQGNEVMAHPPSAIRALELEGKYIGMFTDKSAVDVTTVGKPIEAAPLISPEELDAAIKRAREAV